MAIPESEFSHPGLHTPNTFYSETRGGLPVERDLQSSAAMLHSNLVYLIAPPEHAAVKERLEAYISQAVGEPFIFDIAREGGGVRIVGNFPDVQTDVMSFYGRSYDYTNLIRFPGEDFTPEDYRYVGALCAGFQRMMHDVRLATDAGTPVNSHRVERLGAAQLAALDLFQYHAVHDQSDHDQYRDIRVVLAEDMRTTFSRTMNAINGVVPLDMYKDMVQQHGRLVGDMQNLEQQNGTLRQANEELAAQNDRLRQQAAETERLQERVRELEARMSEAQQYQLPEYLKLLTDMKRQQVDTPQKRAHLEQAIKAIRNVSMDMVAYRILHSAKPADMSQDQYELYLKQENRIVWLTKLVPTLHQPQHTALRRAIMSDIRAAAMSEVTRMEALPTAQKPITDIIDVICESMNAIRGQDSIYVRALVADTIEQNILRQLSAAKQAK